MTELEKQDDGQLLKEFATCADEAAFAELVRRHGTMVYGVCRRVLEDFHEAEDVTQAVFLTLARKAASLRKEPSVGGWLHHVATCLARNARSAAQSRQRREELSMQTTPSVVPPAEDARALREELDHALTQLPARYRLPLVLFHLEERSLEETALMLGLKASAASARLVRGREMLRAQLVRRGVAVGSVGALTVLLSAEAGAAVLPANLVSATVKAAGPAAAGNLAAGVEIKVISTRVAALVKGAEKMLYLIRLKTIAVVAAAAVIIGGVAMYVDLAGDRANQKTQEKLPGIQPAAEEQKPDKNESELSEVAAADAKWCVLNKVKVSVTKEGDAVKAITVTHPYSYVEPGDAEQSGVVVKKTDVYDVVLDDKGKRLADKDDAVLSIIVGKWVEVEGKRKLTITDLDVREFPDLEFAAAQARFHHVMLNNVKVSVTKEGDTVKSVTVRHSRSIKGQDGRDIKVTDVYDVVLDDNGKKLVDMDGVEVPIIEGKWNAVKGKKTLTIIGMNTGTEDSES